ncbi:NLR family CARD domain-containing protein 3 [Gadus morhua]|uniref:NLR family CARD domain-containing protein 3 n=1 Tax=Gadus morhua TaxID=8049 RepID=UPI0011B587EA|nr:NLR family CARD domain-containing protein 3-like [Gadus morhua]
MCKMVTAGKDVTGSCLSLIRLKRVSLVDTLEGRIDALLDVLLSREVFNRDDREDVLCQPGPRARVRKVLDILECKGEEAVNTFLSVVDQPETPSSAVGKSKDQPPSLGYNQMKQKHREVLRRRSESMLYYNTRHGEKILFSDQYVNLLLVNGHQGLDIKRHEVLAYGRKRLSLQQKSAEHRRITPDQLFSTANGARPVKKILVTGVAGIGKTILVQKLLLDFGNNKESLGFDFIIHMTFRDLNLVNKPVNLRELVLRKNRHLAKELDNILANDDKLLIIFDGFDEFRHYRRCDVDTFVCEPDDYGEMEEVFTSLMLGELLPNTAIILTSRPTAIGHIPVGCVDRFVLIAGFSLDEIQDFFCRYFQDEGLAEQLFRVVRENELMLTLCYIPAFCYIICCILKESKDFAGDNPRTMTDIYVQYLVALLRTHTQERAKASGAVQGTCGGEQLSDAVLQLARLAFFKLMDQQTLFYASDKDVATLEGCPLASTFLDKMVAQEPGCTEDVYSFAHLTVQEFFAAVYCAMTDQPLPDVLQQDSSAAEDTLKGHLDLFSRFLSGILSERNTKLLARQVGLSCDEGKAEAYRQRTVSNLNHLCENGTHILNSLHCLFEQQDPSLGQEVRAQALRLNVSDEALSPMDYNAIKYFLNATAGDLSELDLTGTDVSYEALRDLMPHLLKCKQLWVGENALDMDTIQVIAEVLQQSDCFTHLGIGWTDIGDEELLVLSNAIRQKKVLKELWMEGNRVTCRGLLSLSDLTPHPLSKVVAIWNDVTETEVRSLSAPGDCGGDSLTVDFSEDAVWAAWGDWVLTRCSVSSNEKLLTVLHKVCKISTHYLETGWAHTFYRDLGRLVKSRVEQCTEEDVRKRLETFEGVLSW